MATKTYKLSCPDPLCNVAWDEEIDPTAEGPEGLLDGQGAPIECPECGEEWEWNYEAESDILTLLPDAAEEDDGLPLVEDVEDDEEDDPDETDEGDDDEDDEDD